MQQRKERQYIAIDLKSFYASVECVERGLDPLDTNLIVADASRTEKTICLAVSPSLKTYGTVGRPRLFEVTRRVQAVNRSRLARLGRSGFDGSSFSARQLAADQRKKADFIIAKPRMALYLDYSSRINGIYGRYVSADDMHVYSVDEVFIDATPYLDTYGISAHELALRMIRDVLRTTGVTATAGIGSNLYLSKIAMDIVAKKMPPDSDGVRIAELDESSYRRTLWSHRPLTDFWRVGKGTEKRLATYGIYTMGDIARCSLRHEDTLYDLFGVNAELLIDHAWGYEPVRISDIKSYRPSSRSLCNGQVLTEPYSFGKALVVVQEMAEELSFELLEKRLVTNQIVLDIDYDVQSIADPETRRQYKGAVTLDRYGREVPARTHGSFNLDTPTSSTREISEGAAGIFTRCVNPMLLVRRITVTASHVCDEQSARRRPKPRQLSLFTDFYGSPEENATDGEKLKKERRLQETLLNIKRNFGKNSILRGLNYADGATGRRRNRQIGGHHE